MTRHSPGFAPYRFVFERKQISHVSSYENEQPALPLMPPRLGGTVLCDPNHIWYWMK